MSTPEAQREYQRRWVAKRRAEYFVDKQCARCGSTERLELDHIDPRTKVSHDIWSWSQARREAELIKCQVLCKDCHKLKTREQTPITQWKPAAHGSILMYDRGCRCKICTVGARAYWRVCYLRKPGDDWPCRTVPYA